MSSLSKRFSRLFAFFLMTALISTGLPAAANGVFRTVNGIDAVQLDVNVFEVIGRPGARNTDMWCSAADFARRALGHAWKDRIYVVSGFSKGLYNGAPSSVRFTMNPEGAGVEPYENNLILDILTVGYSRSITDANGECRHIVFPFL